MTITVPNSSDGITAAWLTQLLQSKHPNVSVSGVEILRGVHGTATKLKLKLTYERSEGLPEIMWLKAGFGGDHLQKTLALGLYALEAEFYTELLPLVRVHVPECYAAISDRSSGQGVVLLADLDRKDVSFPGYAQPLSVDLVASGLALLADLHGRSWEQPWLEERSLQEFIKPGTAQERHFQSYPVEYIAKFLDGPVGEAVPPEVRDAQRVYDGLWALQPLYRERPFCLIHSDAHPGNSYVVDNRTVGLLDWQLPCQGPWVHDVSYWLAGGLSVEDRRSSERDLLQDYLSRLRGHGVEAPSFEKAWLDYRRFLAYGYWVWLRNPVSMQPLANNVNLSIRYGAAMADHDVFKLLGV